MIDTPKYRLRVTNKYNETYWFVALGHRWDKDPLWNRGHDPHNRRFINRTTSKVNEATVFDTLPEALEVIVTAGNPPDWVAETMDGRAVE